MKTAHSRDERERVGFGASCFCCQMMMILIIKMVELMTWWESQSICCQTQWPRSPWAPPSVFGQVISPSPFVAVVNNFFQLCDCVWGHLNRIKIYPVPNRHLICAQPKMFANIRFILSFSNLYLKNHGILGKLLSPGRPIDLSYLNNASIHTFFLYFVQRKAQVGW